MPEQRVGTHQYETRTGMPGAGGDWIRFQTNGTGVPTDIVDTAGILDTTNPVVRVSQSLFRITMKERWVRVFAHAQLLEPQAVQTQVVAYAEGTNAACTVDVRLVTEALVLNADTTDYEVAVNLTLTNRLGRGETPT
jgi:tRNA U34 5-carboxymethylaminomethyl modifying GTPase MnmE/TrmE